RRWSKGASDGVQPLAAAGDVLGLEKERAGAAKGAEEQRIQQELSQELLSVYTDLLRRCDGAGGPDRSAQSALESGGPPKIRLHRSNYESFRQRGSGLGNTRPKAERADEKTKEICGLVRLPHQEQAKEDLQPDCKNPATICSCMTSLNPAC
ncbi:unnamed protein product, partial [Effrenium voratum]